MLLRLTEPVFPTESDRVRLSTFPGAILDLNQAECKMISSMILIDTIKHRMEQRVRIMPDLTAELLLICQPLRSRISHLGRHLALILHFKRHRGQAVSVSGISINLLAWLSRRARGNIVLPLAKRPLGSSPAAYAYVAIVDYFLK